MGPILSALVGLQKIEIDLSKLRRRRHNKASAVTIQESRIQKHREEHEAIHKQRLELRMQADGLELQLRQSEEELDKLKGVLNTAKTNKEYAAVLTEINTHKADNAKVEDSELKLLAEIDAVKSQAQVIETLITKEEAKLAEIKASCSDDIAKLDKMIDELSAKRAEAAREISPDVLGLFDRIAQQYDGEAMAQIEQAGKKPPYSYACGGCYMSLNAEHANALRTRDEIRQCDNCQRLLYIDEMGT